MSLRFVDQVHNPRARFGDHGPVCNANRRARSEAHTTPQREDGIEDRSRRSGKEPTVDHGGRVADASSSAEEAAPAGFKFGLSYAVALSHRMMRGPDFRFVRRAPPPRGQDGPRTRIVLGLDEEFREGWMGGIGGLRRNDHLGVGRDLDVSRATRRNW